MASKNYNNYSITAFYIRSKKVHEKMNPIVHFNLEEFREIPTCETCRLYRFLNLNNKQKEV